MKKKILFIDNSETIRKKINLTLSNEGYEVLLSENGKNAIHQLNGQNIHLIITELYMPEMNGIEFIKEIRQMPQYQQTPVLFLTTELQSKKKLEAKEAGATGWIVKPFVPSKLLSAISRVIQ